MVNQSGFKLLAAVLVLAVLPAVASAQDKPQRRAGDPAPVELADQLYNVDEVGLSIRLPLNSSVNTIYAGDVRTPQVIGPDAAYVINIQLPKTYNPKATIKEAADQTIALVQGSVGVTDPDQKMLLETQAKLLERIDNLQINDQPAARFYLSIPGTDKKTIVKGYTIFKPAANQFVVFELIVKEAGFAAAKRAYETSLATAKFLDPQAVTIQRGAAIKAGQSLLRMVSAGDMDQWFDNKERWYRLYAPAVTGSKQDAEEIGYRGVRLWKGRRGEVSSWTSKSAWTQADRDEGYLAAIRARVMTPQGPADSEAIYFLSKDRTSESWVLRLALRDRKTGKDLRTAREIGARTDKAMSVMIEQSGEPTRNLTPYFQSDGYLSQIEALLLPRIFATKMVESDFAFYAYQPQLEQVSLRRDRVTKTGRGTDAVWTVETNFTDDSPAQVSTYTAKGELISTTTGDGRVWEPVEPADLMRLWEAKGLPTAPIKQR
ncbi:MAG TPA: hypothetical protein PL072_09270 [Phycisphaerales bacterium]|nr:hypothetical protein [Phycisphaerales bacterium]